MIQIIDENFNLHASKIPDLAKGMQVFRSAHLTYIDSGLSCDTFNIIHITDSEQISFDEVSETLSYYVNKKFAYCVWVNEANLTPHLKTIFDKLSLREQNREPGMILKLEDYQAISNPLHHKIVIANSSESIADFAQVIAENWTPRDENIISYYAKNSKHFLEHTKDIQLAIFYEDDKPVSVIEMFNSGNGNVGFYALATLESYRGKGIGSAVMTFALNKAKSLGYRNVILQASEDGIRIYQKLGFNIQTMYYEFA